MSDIPSIIDPSVIADPHAFYRRLRAESPVHWDAGVNAFLVSTYDNVARIYKDADFSTRSYETTIEAIHGRTVLSMDGLEHSKNRALLTPHLRGKGLDATMGLIARTVVELLDDIAEKQAGLLADQLTVAAEADLVRDFARHFPIGVIADMLGLPAEDLDQFAGWYGDIILFVGNLALDPHVHENGMRSKAELAEYMAPLIAGRRENPGKDLISTLILAEVDGIKMTDVDIRSYISLLLTGGGETTDKSLGSLLRNLLVNRELWEEVRDDRSLVLAAVAETLRFSPPSQMTSRMAEHDMELSGVHVPGGSTMILLTGSANRDESRYANPDTFDLHRSDLSVAKAFTAAADHLAFGSGRHFCIGAMLAKTEMESGLNLLMDRFPDMHIVPDFVPVEVGLKTRGIAALPVQLA